MPALVERHQRAASGHIITQPPLGVGVGMAGEAAEEGSEGGGLVALRRR
ncbi:MAG: hypothetical protein NTY65_02305 [Planctomycetota bacterium]|nr:hypothetical protein [Planctomycetota bacterium]